MELGYLFIETHPGHRGLVRIAVADHPPAVPGARHEGRRVRYIARFNDAEAGLMHVHTLLRRRLVDVDGRLYRSSLERAVAAAESVGLRHGRLYLDPDLEPDRLEDIRRRGEALAAARRGRERLLQGIGYATLAWLLLMALWGLR
jgi:hypothetical protein